MAFESGRPVSTPATVRARVRDPSANDDSLTLPPPPSGERSDRMFLPAEFPRVQRELGQNFTFDAACNNDGSNRLCARFACPEKSFFDRTDFSDA